MRQVRGHHDWTTWSHSPLDGTSENYIQHVLKINASTKSLVELLCDLQIFPLSVLRCTGSISAPDEATLKLRPMPYSVLLSIQCLRTSLLCVGSVCGLGPDLVGIHPLCQLRGPLSDCSLFEHAQPRPSEPPRRSRQLEKMTVLLFLRSAPFGKRNVLLLPWLVALRKRSLWHVASTAMENLMILHIGKRSISIDHASVRAIVQKTTIRRRQGKHIPSWMSKHLRLLLNFETNQ